MWHLRSVPASWEVLAPPEASVSGDMFGCRLTLFALSAFALGGALAQHDQQVACYLGSWAVYRPDSGKFDIEDIDPTLCTTLIYSFAGLNETTYNIKSLDPEYDINKRAYEKFVNLKSLNPRLKVLMAVGGWTEGSKKYSAMASTSETRKIFINSVIKFIQKHKFDGLDLDWEYPANRGGVPEDKENFVDLVKELRKEFEKYGWMLTAALAAGKSTIETAYDIEELAEELDFIHIMAYDYHGKWDGRTGHNAPLYSREDEPEDEKSLNVDATVKLYLESGAPPHKLLLGVGLYGRTFLLSDVTNPGISSPSLPTAFAGPYTREDGFLGYNEICEKQRTEAGAWKVVWQKAHQAPYMYRDNMWVGYDDNFSLSLKVAYAQSLGLGGIMVWSIDTDDFTGSCAKNSIRFPMLRSINQALTIHAEKRPVASTTTTKPITKKPVEIDIDIDDDDDDIDLDVDNDLDDYKYNIDDSRTSSVGADGDGDGSSAITPALSILLALLMTAAVAR